MAVAEKSITLQEKPQKLWGALSTMENWTFLANTRYFGGNFDTTYEVLPGQVPGPGMRFHILIYGKPRQEWEMVDWEPPKRFKATSLACTGPHGLNVMSTEATLEVTITPVDSLDTKVDIRFELNFSSWLGPILNLVFPIGMRMQKVLNNLADRLPRLLEDPAAAGR